MEIPDREIKLIQTLKRISNQHLQKNVWDDAHKPNCPGCFAQKAIKEWAEVTQYSISAYDRL